MAGRLGVLAFVVFAALGAAVNGLTVYLYQQNTICDPSGSIITYEGSKGECFDTSGGGDSSSVLITCQPDGFDLTRFDTSNCAGASSTIVVTGVEDSCLVSGENSYKYSGCSTDCFPADATVETLEGGVKRMDEIVLGDSVRVSGSEFSEVYFWGHKDADTVSTNFVQITLRSGRALVLSKNHMLYSSGKLVPAAEVAVADVLVDVEFGLSVVSEVRSGVAKKGLYNPHTIHGDIAVDGVVTSTYTSVQLPTLTHVLLAVERAAFRLGFSVLGNMLETQRPAVLNWYMRTAGSVQ